MIRTLAPLALALALLSGCGGDVTLPGDLPPVATPVTALAPPATRSFGDRHPIDFGPRGPQSYPVHGIDAARFQGTIDWQAARRAGVGFAFLKATEGGDRVDEAFARNWNASAAAGVARGAYHFYYFCTPAETQARWYIRNVPKEPGALPPVLDLEWNPFSPTCTYRPPAETVRAEARTFLDILTRHYGQRPVIYTTPEFYDRNDIGRLGGEVWLRSVAEPPHVTYPGARWTFWQYTATGRVGGITGDVDLNAFAGSRSAWDSWYARRQIR